MSLFRGHEAEATLFYFSKKVDDNRLLCLAPITSRQIERSDSPPENDSGYFLIEQTGVKDPVSVRIIAQVHTDDAALHLKEMMGLA